MATAQLIAEVQSRQLPATVAQDLSRLLDHARDLLGRDQGEAALLLARATQLLEASAGGASCSKGLAPWQVTRLTRYVDAHLGGPILQKELADQVRLSLGHFARTFQRSFGRTPHTYVMERRIARAKALMTRTAMPLCEIAITCGLADQSHFCRVFRRFVGSTPLSWQRQHRRSPHEMP